MSIPEYDETEGVSIARVPISEYNETEEVSVVRMSIPEYADALRGLDEDNVLDVGTMLVTSLGR